MTTQKIIQGDSIDVLKTIENESVDLLCTDPPYGYNFMGKSWDKTLPDIGIFKECLRVLKPGSFAFVMSAPRSDVCARMMLMLEDAGFEIGFTPIYWTYASGFPKAMNMAKAVDKRNGVEFEESPASGVGFMNAEGKDGYNVTKNKLTRVGEMSDEAKALDGSYGGFQPKPAVEVVIVAMKPLSEKTFVDQALKNGKGITWLDDCRVPTAKGDREEYGRDKELLHANTTNALGKFKKVTPYQRPPEGRFPANLLVQGEALNGQSKYFNLDEWAKTLPFLTVPKASKREKGKENKHPTVKPLTLMSYLITLGSRPGDIVLDPFLGSGTTALAAKKLSRGYIGIEREKEYIDIASARLDSTPEPLF